MSWSVCRGAVEIPVTVAPWSDADDYFALCARQVETDEGYEEMVRFVAKEFEKHPTPNIKARYARLLIEADADPKIVAENEAKGLALLAEAVREGSPEACAKQGAIYLQKKEWPINGEVGLQLLKLAEDNGAPNAALVRGYFHFSGYGWMPEYAEAEACYRKALRGQYYSGMCFLAGAYAKGSVTGSPDPKKAAALYYETACRHSGEASEYLKKHAEQGDVYALKYNHMLTLSYLTQGYQQKGSRMFEAVNYLLAHHPDDPEALVLLGQIYALQLPGLEQTNFDKAHALFDAAIALGSDSARAEKTWLVIQGRGVKREVDIAMTELNALAAKGEPVALGILGYLYYWGDKGIFKASNELKKDPVKAFYYSQLAADAGSFVGALNLGTFYKSGVGTEKNYAKAARYFLESCTYNGDQGFMQVLPHAKPKR